MSHAEDYATLSALIQGVDRTARAMETKWGVDRLPLLVDTDMLAKLKRQQAKWRFALETCYEAKTITGPMMEAAKSTSGGMERAWAALDAAATEAGHVELSPDVWEVRLGDGKVAALVRTVAEAAHPTVTGRYVVVYTLDEIGNVIDALPAAIGQAKIAFPGAVVQPQRATAAERAWVKHGDPGIPF